MKIHVMHTGEVRVSPYLPFGGDNCNMLKASGLTTPKNEQIWLPVSVYLIEHPKGLILVDTGWHRNMSPEGFYDKKAKAEFSCDALVFATGQKPEDQSAYGVDVNEKGFVKVKKGGKAGGKFFAAGDIVNGGKTVVEAVAEGKEAAASIIAYLEKKGVKQNGS